MKFTLTQAALWIALSFTATIVVAMLFVGHWFTFMGLSLALNLYLGWYHVGHQSMLIALGLIPHAQPENHS
jgi:hypothetical protein